MATPEVWARNPHSYIRECVETNSLLIAWDRGILRKFRIDPFIHARDHMAGKDYRVLAIGDQGAAEIGPLNTMHNPKAVYPVWEYNQMSLDQLEEWMARNCAEELRHERIARRCPADEIPVPGQEHRVVVTRLPHLSTGIGRKFFATLGLMQLDYPDCILHVHGYTTFSWISSGIRAGDLDHRALPSKGRVFLPNGRRMPWEDTNDHRRWVNLLGWRPADLQEPRNRCMFSIQAAHWAAEHWAKDPHLAATPRLLSNEDFVKVLNGAVELDGQETKRFSTVTGYNKEKKPLPLVGDKFYCEACSFAPKCRAFRVGSICSVPDAESAELARHFKTRDSGLIIEGLGRLMEGGVERWVEGRNAEKSTGELDPHVTKIQSELYKQGVALAKLVDPRLRSAAVAIQMNAGNGIQVNGATGAPTLQGRVAAAKGALEQAGVPEKMITAEMIERCMALGTDPESLQRIVVEEAARFQLPAGFLDDDEVYDAMAVDGEVIELT